MTSILISFGASAFAVAFFSTLLVRYFAVRHSIIDKPHHEKNVHHHPIPRLGGLAIFLAVALAIIGSLLTSNWLTSGTITPAQYIGFLLGGFVLMIGGLCDDKYDLSPRYAIIAPLVATLVVIISGVNIQKLTNPFGGVIILSAWQSDVIVFGWLMCVMYTTKFLDGLDGLATSVTSIGAFMILLLALTVAYFQPDVALLAAIVIGAELGFLFWNFHPASIFLGEGGSTFVGFSLGVLAVISGGKLATALLVLGIPLLDLIWVLVRRIRKGGIKQITKGDRKHLHHRLFDLGWSQRRIMFTYVFVASLFGTLTLFLQSGEKLIILILLVVLMILAAALLVNQEKEENFKD